MSEMQAIVVDPNADRRLSIQWVPMPEPKPSECLVRVKAVSLNLGETRLSQRAEADWRPGWDVAGFIEKPAEDGSGPPAGSRIVGFIPNRGWAQFAAVPTGAIATLPAAVSFATASTLPVAGLTALHALEKGGSLIGRKVLITGASGGVGHFAVQLAHHAGAYVVGLVRSDNRASLVRGSGADEVVVSDDPTAATPFGPYDVVLESVSGPTFGASMHQLASDGICVVYGTSAGYDVAFDTADFFMLGGASIYGLTLGHELKREPASRGLARLLKLVEAGVVRPHISLEADWTEIGTVAGKLLDRLLPGKAVLHIE